MLRKGTARPDEEGKRGVLHDNLEQLPMGTGHVFDRVEALRRLARHVDPESLQRETLSWLGTLLPAHTRLAISLDPSASEPSFILARGSVRAWEAGRTEPPALVVTPILDEGEAQGWLGVFADSLPRKSQRSDMVVPMLCLAADLVGLPARNARAFFELREMSMRDELTGLQNRRSFYEALQREVSFAERHRQRLSLAYFDIDDFKEINDHFGHAVGDEVLRGFAGALVSSVRSTDVVARIGGDEFVALLPQATAEQASRLRSALENRLRVAAVGDESAVAGPLSLSFSLGVSDLSRTREGFKGLMELADIDLYRDKSARKGTSRAHARRKNGPRTVVTRRTRES